MDLIIGRDANTAQLKVVNGTQVTLIGNPASVPMDVSRQHCKLEVIDKDTFVITNIKAANVTWVNGIQVQSKQITLADKVQLGTNKYNLPLAEIIKQTEPNIADITPLRTVWENYNNSLIANRKRQQQNNLLSRVPMVFTLLGSVIAAASEGLRSVSIVFTVIAATIMLYGFYRIATDKSIEEQERLKKDFQNNYVCPKCGRFLGFQDYDIISQHSNCPYCRAQYKV